MARIKVPATCVGCGGCGSQRAGAQFCECLVLRGEGRKVGQRKVALQQPQLQHRGRAGKGATGAATRLRGVLHAPQPPPSSWCMQTHWERLTGASAGPMKRLALVAQHSQQVNICKCSTAGVRGGKEGKRARACIAACEASASRVGASSSAMVRCSRAHSCPVAWASGPLM